MSKYILRRTTVVWYAVVDWTGVYCYTGPSNTGTFLILLAHDKPVALHRYGQALASETTS